MAAQLSLASAKVTNGDEVVAASAQVLVRGDTMTLRHSGTSEQLEHVQSVEAVSRGVWLVRFPDGTELTVTRSGRTCCGGRR